MNPPAFPSSPGSANELAHPPVRKRGVIIAIVIILILILGGGGVTAYAAMQGWITLPFNLLAPKPPTIQDIAKALSSVSSGELTFSVNYSTQSKEANTPILPSYPKETKATSSEPGVSSIDLTDSIKSQSSKYFMDAKIGIETTNSFDTGNKKDSQGKITLTYQNSGMSLTFDTDYIYANETFFIKLNAFPLPMLDFSTLTNKWIHFPKKGLNATALIMGDTEDEQTAVWEKETSASSTDDNTQKSFEQKQKEMILFRNKLIEKNAITIESSERAKDRDGSWIWVLRLKLIPDRLIEAIDATVDDHTDAAKHEIFTEDLKKEIHRPDVETWIKTVISSVTSEMTVDPKTFMPIHQSFHARFATENSSKLETPKQFMIDTTYTLANINHPKAITEPKESISLTKAIQRLSGQSDEDITFQQQTSAVLEIREALRVYQDTHNQYPDTLSQLIGEKRYTEQEIASFNTPSSGLNLGPLSQEHVARIPNDLYTGAAFAYTPTADKKDYALKYQVHFASSTNGYLGTSYVEGLNTATPMQISVEAEITRDSDNDGLLDSEEQTLHTSVYSKDTDLDGLSDYDEVKKYHTNPLLKDTDGDGYTDKQEIDGGFDPLSKAKK